MPLSLARDRHAEARKTLAVGIYPMEQRKIAKNAVAPEKSKSFQGIAQLWMEHWKTDKSQRYADSTRRRLEDDVYPALDAIQILNIKTHQILTMVKAIEARGAGDIAKRVLETTGQISRFAIAHGYAKRNPAAEIRPADILRPLRR